MALQQALQTHVPTIKGMIAKAENQPDGIVQSTVDDISSLALKTDLAYWLKLHMKRAGIHPCNRGGSGVDPVW